MLDIFFHRNASPLTSAESGPLAGLRIVVQPNLSVKGWPCDAGARALAGYVALEDATLADRLTRAGAVLEGSSRMAELGLGLAGDTTVQAIAQGFADLALITDALGEARAAAACAGLFALKPSHGLLSRNGLFGLVPSMESVGLAAADPVCIGQALAVMSGADPGDPSMPEDCTGGCCTELPPLASSTRAGVIAECLEELDSNERKTFEASLARLAANGITTEKVSFGLYALFADAHQAIAAVEASSSAGKYDGVRYGHRSPAGRNWNEMYLNTRAESFGPLVKPFLFQGAYFQFENYTAFENACRIRGRLLRSLDELLGQVDLLVLPTRRPALDPARAATVEALYAAFALTLPASLTGHPALQVPDPTLNSGADMGLQLIGRRLDDLRLLSIGRHLAISAQEGR